MKGITAWNWGRRRVRVTLSAQNYRRRDVIISRHDRIFLTGPLKGPLTVVSPVCVRSFASPTVTQRQVLLWICFATGKSSGEMRAPYFLLGFVAHLNVRYVFHFQILHARIDVELFQASVDIQKNLDRGICAFSRSINFHALDS